MIRLIIFFWPVRLDLPLFRFNTYDNSLQSNEKVLEKFRYDLDKLITSYKGNIISLGSEFRDPVLLASILYYYSS